MRNWSFDTALIVSYMCGALTGAVLTAVAVVLS